METGFAKNRPAAQRLSGSAAPRPTGPRRPATARRPTAHDDPAARSRFSIVFCPVVNPCACTGLHRVWACKMYDGEFEFGYYYNIKQSFRSFSILSFVAYCYMYVKMLSFSVYSSVYKTRKRGSPFSTM